MKTFKQLSIPLLLTALTALVLAGCGGGGDETTATAEKTTEATPNLSKAELIAQGDAICGEVNAAVGSVGSSAAEPADQVEQVATLYTGMVERLKDLGTPKEDAATYAEFIAAAESLAAAEGKAKLAAERNDSTALGEAGQEATPALESFESTAELFGFEECSEGPSAPAATGTGSESSGEEVEPGGIEAEPELEEEVAPEEIVPEEVAPETGGAGGGVEEAAPEEEESGGGGSSGGVGPG
jgi:hypothetical protein